MIWYEGLVYVYIALITQTELGQSSSYQICSSEKKVNLARIVGLVDDYGRRISNESINYVCDCGYVPTKTTRGTTFVVVYAPT